MSDPDDWQADLRREMASAGVYELSIDAAPMDARMAEIFRKGGASEIPETYWVVKWLAGRAWRTYQGIHGPRLSAAILATLRR